MDTLRLGHRAPIVCILSAALLIAACGILGPGSYVELGELVFYDDTVQITAPDTASVGQAFEVIVGVFGGYCTKVDRTEVEIFEVMARIRPYNRVSLGACPDVGKIIGHTASVRFDVPGLAAIRVTGRKKPVLSPGDTLVTLVRDVVVVR